MSIYLTSDALREYLQKTIPELVIYAEEAHREIWQPGDDDVDGLRMMERDFFYLTHQIVRVGDSFSENKIALTRSINGIFDPDAPDSNLVSNREMRERYQRTIRSSPNLFVKQRTPGILGLLNLYDSIKNLRPTSMPSNHAEKGRTMFFDCADTIINADVTVTKYEAEFLTEFKDLLYS